MSRYDQQIFIILPMLDDTSANDMVMPLVEKWYQQHGRKCEYSRVKPNWNSKRFIDGKVYFNYIVEHAQWNEAFSKITPKTRIYIDSHCYDGSNILESDELVDGVTMALHYEELAAYFNMFIPRRVCSPKAVLHINLLGCEAGGKVTSAATSQNPARPINDSFAAKLSHCLKKDYDISIPVVARTGAVHPAPRNAPANISISKKPVCFDVEAYDYYRHITDIYSDWYEDKIFNSDQHGKLRQAELSRVVEKFAPKQHPFSKVVYKYNDAGQQVCLDAYSNWREL
jgi:hypothetical protein